MTPEKKVAIIQKNAGRMKDQANALASVDDPIIQMSGGIMLAFAIGLSEGASLAVAEYEDAESLYDALHECGSELKEWMEANRRESL